MLRWTVALTLAMVAGAAPAQAAVSDIGPAGAGGLALDGARVYSVGFNNARVFGDPTLRTLPSVRQARYNGLPLRLSAGGGRVAVATFQPQPHERTGARVLTGVAGEPLRRVQTCPPTGGEPIPSQLPPVLSGADVAFATCDRNPRAVLVSGPAGTRKVTVPQPIGDLAAAGRTLAISYRPSRDSDRQVVQLTDLDGAAPQRTVALPEQFAFAALTGRPDGTVLVAAQTKSRQPCATTVLTIAAAALTATETPVHGCGFTLAPTGDGRVALLQPSGKEFGTRLAVADLATGASTVLDAVPVSFDGPTFVADDRRVVWQHARCGGLPRIVSAPLGQLPTDQTASCAARVVRARFHAPDRIRVTVRCARICRDVSVNLSDSNRYSIGDTGKGRPGRHVTTLRVDPPFLRRLRRSLGHRAGLRLSGLIPGSQDEGIVQRVRVSGL